MKIGLIGNQNSGKTTLFNCLTGMNAKIGNWPGVTIEKKSGKVKGTKFEIVDLPGIYSLSPYSSEEEVSRKFVFDEKPDVIINIIDATAIERSLYLTTQLLELDSRIIVALNMSDMLEEKGFMIDTKKLEEKLGVRVLKISALKETGIDELIKEIGKTEQQVKPKVFDLCIENAADSIIKSLDKKVVHKKFVAIKLLENDERFKKQRTKLVVSEIEKIEKNYDTDIEEVVATERYDFIERILKDCLIKKRKASNTSDKLDGIFLNRWLSFPIFAAIMFAIYYLSVGIVGSFTVEWVGEHVGAFGEWIRENLAILGVMEWLNSLIVDGIIAGVGAVLGFVPQLVILFICISLLETTGYMARISMMLDRVFRKIGLNGKSIIPFIVGSGCSVPGIMGTRIIENEDERKMTSILTPFIPCSAKLPIIVLFAGYFFPNNAGLVSASLYFFAIAVIIISALVMKKFVFKNTSSTYIFELPEYKLPSIKYVAKDVWDKVISFIKRAGTVILLCSIVIWFLLSFSFSMEYGVDIENSMLAIIGTKISWVFYPMLGENSWGAAVSAIQGLVAKEQVVSSMAVINGLADDVETGNMIFSNNGMFGFFTAASAYAFMVFNLFSAPCFGAIGAMQRELGGTRRMLIAVTFQTVLAWILATLVYQIGSRISGGSIVNILLILGLLLVVGVIIHSMLQKKDKCAGCAYCDSCKR